MNVVGVLAKLDPPDRSKVVTLVEVQSAISAAGHGNEVRPGGIGNPLGFL
jgi:hypothetical protein